MISVGIIEDMHEIRNSIVEFLSTQKNILCEVSVESVEDFLEVDNNEIKIDVLLLDIDLPGMSGIAGIKYIKEKFPEIDIIMLTVYENHDRIFQSLQSGATGYLLKHTAFPKIAEAIHEIHAGGAPMSPIIARKIINHFSNKQEQKSDSSLTEKEETIVNYLVDGFTYNKIAETLGNSVDTIRHHIKNIYKKLHVNSKTELIKKKLFK